MKETLIVSARGQVTLPASLRKSLGIGKDTVLTAETVEGRIVLTPSMVVEIDHYSDEQIAEWVRADQFEDGEREALEARLERAGK